MLLSGLSLIVVIGIGVVLIASFDRLVTDSKNAVAGLSPGSTGASELHTLAVLADWFAVLLIAATALLLVWIAVVTYGLRRDVLTPLQSLGAELDRVAAGDFESPITIVGPPELAEVSGDAEEMRRALVAQIDSTRAAQDGLAQEGPLANAIEVELSTPTDATASGYTVHGIKHAAEGVVSGDWWDVVSVSGGRTGLIVADATGHGPEAGIAALRVKTATRFLLADDVSPAQIMKHLDRVFQDRDGRFVTLFVAVLDPSTGTAQWASAGHEPALLRRADGTYEKLTASGPLLSRLSGTWVEHTESIAAGDVLIAYTDGLAESLNSSAEPLGSSGVQALADAAIGQHGVDAVAIASQIEVDARVRAANWANDDFTLVVVNPTT